MIDEYHTSKLCHKCENEVCHNYKRNITDKYPVWGLVCCTNKECIRELKHYSTNLQEKNIIGVYKNRDRNSTLNMIKIVEYLKEYNERPANYINKNNYCL